ncbi:MAG: acyltransferase [Chloroflexota bacterium]
MLANQRRYDVDWLRTLALGLLIVYHIAVAFQPFGSAILFIQNEETLDALWVPMRMLNVWRIPILFLISGMGVAFAMRRRSWRALLNDRTARILLPLLFGSIFIAPISIYLATIWYQLNEGGGGSYVPTAAHLWFLSNIYLYVLLLLPLFTYFKNHPENRFLQGLGWLVSQPLGIFIISHPVVAETLLVQPWSFETYASTLHGLALGLVLFLTGFLFISVERDFWPAVTRHRFVALLLGVVLYAFRITFETSPMWLIGIESVSWMLAILGFGALYLNQSSKGLRYLSAAVYPIYIIHLPVQTALSYLLFQLELSAWIKFILLVIGTFTLSFVLYEFVLRRVNWMRPLFGMQREGAAAPAQAKEAVSETLSWGTILGVTGFILTAVAGIIIALFFIFGSGSPETELLNGSVTDRFRAEGVSRSAEENLLEVESLWGTLNAALDAEDIRRTHILALEIFVLLDVVENPDAEGLDPSLQETIERKREEADSRSSEENLNAARGLTIMLREGIGTREIGRAKDHAVEIYAIMAHLQEMGR